MTTNVPPAVFGPPKLGRPGPPLIVQFTGVAPTENSAPEVGVHFPGVAPCRAVGFAHVTTAPEEDPVDSASSTRR